MTAYVYGTLREAFEATDLSLDEIWMRYFGLGGSASLRELDAVLHEGVVSDRLQHNVLAHALNERFTELGMNHPAPYRENLTQS